MLELRKILYEVYGAYGDNRYKNPDIIPTFVADFREDINIGNDGRPRLNFCEILVEVASETEVEIILRGNIPLSPAVQEWIDAQGISLRNQHGHCLIFKITTGEQHKIDDLAERIKAITAPGMQYSESSYKRVCPQVEGCLKLLRKNLDKAWETTIQDAKP